MLLKESIVIGSKCLLRRLWVFPPRRIDPSYPEYTTPIIILGSDTLRGQGRGWDRCDGVIFGNTHCQKLYGPRTRPPCVRSELDLPQSWDPDMQEPFPELNWHYTTSDAWSRGLATDELKVQLQFNHRTLAGVTF